MNSRTLTIAACPDILQPVRISLLLLNDSSKIFAGLYAIYSGLLVVATTALILAPALHRFLHRLHVKDEQDPDDDDDDKTPAARG